MRSVGVKRLVLPFSIASSIALIALAGGLGYITAGEPGLSLPLARTAATPTPPVRTVSVTRGDVRQVLTVPGEVIPARQQSLSFSAGGRLIEVTVRAGDTITRGQTLARLDAEPLKLALAQAQADLETKQAALKQLKSGASASDLTAANAAVKDAQVGLQSAQYNLTVVQKSDTVSKNVREREYEANFYEANYGDYLNKYNAGKIDKNRLDIEWNNLITAKERLETARTQAALALSEANQKVAQAQETLRKAQANLASLKATPVAADVKQAQAAVDAADLALKKAQADLDRATLRAPFSGRVLSVAVQTGDTVAANAAVLTVADLAQLEVQTTVGQADVILVQAGQSASLTFDARPGETFSGQVSRVVPTKASTSGAVNYNVFVALDQAPPGLLPGMTSDADLVVAERKRVLTLPRRSIRARANATIQLQVLQRGQVTTREVKTGLLGDLNFEILSGLQEGDQVVVSQ
jgi:HlyD family secretion protein